jgi:hypothetical protein
MSKSMKLKVPAFLMALALTAPLALAAYADSPALPSAATPDQVTTSKLVYGLLSDSRYAYRPRALDAATSKDVFKRYLESLDGSKQFFTQADITRFAPFEANISTAIRRPVAQARQERLAAPEAGRQGRQGHPRNARQALRGLPEPRQRS